MSQCLLDSDRHRLHKRTIQKDAFIVYDQVVAILYLIFKVNNITHKQHVLETFDEKLLLLLADFCIKYSPVSENNVYYMYFAIPHRVVSFKSK